MACKFFLGRVQLPVAPSKLKVKVKNKNKTVELLSGGELNIIKAPGLKEISFDALLPNRFYPFADYPNGFQKAAHYIDILASVKAVKTPIRFIVTEQDSTGSFVDDSNYLVTIEDYTITRDASDGDDVTVSINLKEYVEHTVKTIVVKPSRDQSRRDAYASRSYADKNAVAKAYVKTERPIDSGLPVVATADGADHTGNTGIIVEYTKSSTADISGEPDWDNIFIKPEYYTVPSQAGDIRDIIVKYYGAKYLSQKLEKRIEELNKKTLDELDYGGFFGAWAVKPGTRLVMPRKEEVLKMKYADE